MIGGRPLPCTPPSADGPATAGHPPGVHMCLVGPTASGKSAVAMDLARMRIAAGVPTEIVSCDSMQVYRGMDIGTAKPTAAERAEVPHHLIDIADPSEDHNLPRFLHAARDALAGIEARGAAALLVGGTGLYVRALVDDFTPPPHFPDIAAELESNPDTAELAARLHELDPVALERIPAGNRRRIIRALEVGIGTGVPFSEHGEAFGSYPATPFVMCGLRPDRDVIAEAIGDRFDAQMAAGFLDEVAALSKIRPPMSRTARQALGYRELLAHLRGETDLEGAVSEAKLATRRFAVRQLRWFGRDPRIEWFDPPDADRTAAQLATELDLLWRKSAAGGTGGTGTVEPASSPAPPSARTGEARPPRSTRT